MPRKVFEVSVEDPSEPIEFAVRFHFADDTGSEEEVFHALPRNAVPASATFTFASIWRINDAGNSSTNLSGMLRYFQEVLPPEDYARFDAMIHDKRRIVTIAALWEVMTWLIREYGGRPTTPS